MLWTPDGELPPVFSMCCMQVELEGANSFFQDKQNGLSWITIRFLQLSSVSHSSSSLMPTVRKWVCLSTSRWFLCSGWDVIPMDYINSLSHSSRKKCNCNKDLLMCPLAKIHKVTEWSKSVTEGQKLCILLLLFPCLQMSQQRWPIICYVKSITIS